MKNKLKSLKAFSKRIRKQKSCFLRKKANKSHLLRRKSAKTLRVLSSPTALNLTQAKLAKRLIIGS